MDEETKKNIKEVQQNNNYPGLEKLIRLVRAKYKGAISRNDVKQFLAKDLPTQLNATQQKIRSKGHIVAFVKDEMANGYLCYQVRFSTLQRTLQIHIYMR